MLGINYHRGEEHGPFLQLASAKSSGLRRVNWLPHQEYSRAWEEEGEREEEARSLHLLGQPLCWERRVSGSSEDKDRQRGVTKAVGVGKAWNI